MLVQVDASPYKWLEGRWPEMDLHGAIDDATGKVLALHLRPHEDMLGYLEIFRQMIVNHGVPRSLYTDDHTMFKSPLEDKLSIEDQLAGRVAPLTQIGLILQELGINHIRARSPQAKGRVERLWETLQGRLMIEMRWAGVSTIEQANLFLPRFIKRYNARFSVAPASPESAYRLAPSRAALDQILALKESRQASNGSTISYYGQTYQLIKDGAVAALRARAKVSVLTHIDGRLTAICEGQEFDLRPFTLAPPEKEQPVVPAPRKSSAHEPAKTHPWRSKGPLSPRRDPIEDYFLRKDREWQRMMAQR
ncbi:MAG: ISNCY family transposase [Bacillota bacterium]